MLRTFTLAAGLLLAQVSTATPAHAQRTLKVRPDCTASRCVLRDQRGSRLGTVERDTTGRYIFRDKARYRTRTAEVQRDGTIRIEKFGRRR